MDILFCSNSRTLPPVIEQYAQSGNTITSVDTQDACLFELSNNKFDCVFIENDELIFTGDTIQSLIATNNQQVFIGVYNTLIEVDIKKHLKQGIKGVVLNNEIKEQFFSVLEIALFGGVYISKAVRQMLHSQEDATKPKTQRKSAKKHSQQKSITGFWGMATTRLTARQLEVLMHMLDGVSNKEIADTLFISRGTVSQHIVNIFKGLEADNRQQVFVMAQQGEVQLSRAC